MKTEKNFKLARIKDSCVRWLFTLFAFASLIFLLGIIIVLCKEALPIFKTVKVFDFIFGKDWYPTYRPPEYGVWPLIVSSLYAMGGALLICVPLGLGSALYINELAPPKIKHFLKSVVELLASIPSIVYGFFGMALVAPTLQKLLNIPVGLCLFTACLTLGIMATPIVCSIAEDALSNVPNLFREASYAVGANRWQTLTRVVVPAAGSGISTAIILGMSRAIGETMTVLMVAGGAAMIPHSLFDPSRPMTAAIAAEMGEADMLSNHYYALFAIALILFIITFIFNTAAEFISRRFRIKLGLAG